MYGNIKIFFSSVAVYGLNKKNPDEEYPKDPFNHYGKSKWQAEQVLECFGGRDCDADSQASAYFRDAAVAQGSDGCDVL